MNGGGVDHSAGVACNSSTGGPHVNGRVPAPCPYLCAHWACKLGTHTGTGIGAPSPLAYNGNVNGACANPEAVPPLFCAPCPSQRGHTNWGLCANPSTPSFGAGVTCEWEVAWEWERVHPSPFVPLFALCVQWWSTNQGPCANPEVAPPPSSLLAGVTREQGGARHLPPFVHKGGMGTPGHTHTRKWRPLPPVHTLGNMQTGAAWEQEGVRHPM